jgi:DnaJ-class molecular chaperone
VTTLILLTIAAIAIRVGVLYLRPFGRCPKCKGRGNIQRGKRRPVCPRCKGLKRIQRTGSRAVHRLVFKIHHGRQTAARYQQREDRP